MLIMVSKFYSNSSIVEAKLYCKDTQDVAENIEKIKWW